MTELTIWVHKQSEVIVTDKPKGLMSALYDEYHHVEQLEQLQSESADLDTDNSLGLLQDRITELEKENKGLRQALKDVDDIDDFEMGDIDNN